MKNTKAKLNPITESIETLINQPGESSHKLPAAEAAFPFERSTNENIKYFIGIDLHSDNIVACVKETVLNPAGGVLQGRTVKCMKVKTRGTAGVADVEKSLSPYCNLPHMACVESTYNWYWLSNLFERNHWSLRMADPCTVSQNRIKSADDQTDAAYLAERMRTNSLHTAPVMGREARAVRDLTRYRTTLVKDRSRKKIALTNQIANHTSRKVHLAELVRKARDLLEPHKDEVLTNDQIRNTISPALSEYVEDEETAWIMADELKAILSLDDDIESISKRIAESVKPTSMAKRLSSIRGCGEVLSAVISTEIADIRRFKSGKDFQSYCRLAPTSRLSNGKSKGSGNAKNGNAYLSWALTELANFVVRFNPIAEKEYQRLLKRAGGLRVRAIRSLAAKLSRAVYHMLRDDEDFDLCRCFAR